MKHPLSVVALVVASALAACAQVTAPKPAPRPVAATPAAPVSAAPTGMQRCYISEEAKSSNILVYTLAGIPCQAGAPMTIRNWRLTAFITEQLCDFNKSITHPQGDDSEDQRTQCVYSGRILNTAQAGPGGFHVRYGRKVGNRVEVAPDPS